MKRQTLNFIVDAFAILMMLAVIATGLLLRFVLPPRSGFRGLVLSGWSRHDWGDLHFWLAVMLAALLAVHVFLHWRWVCETVRTQFARKRVARPTMRFRTLVLSGTAFTLIVIGLFSMALWFARTDLQQGGSGRGQGYRGGRATALVSTALADSPGQKQVQLAEQQDRQDGRGRQHRRGWQRDRD